MTDLDFFKLTPGAEKLLLDLARRAPDEQLHFVAYVPPQGVGEGVTHVGLERGLGSPALSDLYESSEGGGVVIVPDFSASFPAELSVGLPPGWHEVSRWQMEEFLIAKLLPTLREGGRMVALVSAGLLAAKFRRGARQDMLTRGLCLVAKLPNELLWEHRHPVDTYLLLFEKGRGAASSLVMLDESEDAARLPSARAFQTWLSGDITPEGKEKPVFVERRELGSDLRLEPAYYNPDYLQIQAPEGFSEEFLGDVAEIIGGARVSTELRLSAPSDDSCVPFVQVRHMSADDTLADSLYWLPKEIAEAHANRLARPGDILISVTGTVGKVVLLGEDYPQGVRFDTSIRRVRLQEGLQARAAEVAEFLRSELGQLQFQRFAAGSVIMHLNMARLRKIQIFLPEEQANEQEPRPVSISYAQNLAAQLQVILTQIQEHPRAEWQEPIAAKLRKMATELSPPTLSERVRQSYPAPLAIPYRRYMMAEHNPYEQLDRMINLVEACTYFVFHVLVADLAQAQWRTQLELPKHIRGALRSRASFNHRIQFIRHITEIVREQGHDLFVPGLATCDIIDDIDVFRDELRNRVAHSAPGSEPYVAELIRTHHDRLCAVLDRLEFLSQYTMCRVRSHYFQRGAWHYRCELYRGEEYDINLEDVPLAEEDEGGRLIAAEREHLVLISPELEFLDLWPYYQLYFGEATCRESHLCVVKHITKTELHGESVRSGLELTLPGRDNYYEGNN